MQRGPLKILVSITSFYEDKIQYLNKVIESYTDLSTQHNIKFSILLTTNYDYKFNSPILIKHIITQNIESHDHSSNHCWSNKSVLYNIYKDYDYIIESDDDILITYENLQYYFTLEKNIPFNYIPGFLVTESNTLKEQIPITLLDGDNIGDIIEINNLKWFFPYNVHSACFIADKKRFDYFIQIIQKRTTPTYFNQYGYPESSRSEIYFYFNKVISIDYLKNTLVQHLPNKYVNEKYDKNIITTPVHLKYKNIDYWRNKLNSALL